MIPRTHLQIQLHIIVLNTGMYTLDDLIKLQDLTHDNYSD